MIKYSAPKHYGGSHSSYWEREVHCSECGGHIGTQNSIESDVGYKFEIPVMKFYNNCPYCGKPLFKEEK